MKKRSVKWKITLWLTLLMALLSGLMLTFMLVISRSVTDRTYRSLLSQTLRSNAACVSYADGNLEFDEGFRFYQNGVTTLVYHQNQALLAGQVPVGFSSAEAFESGRIRTVSAAGNQYLMLDLWVPSGWDRGLWIRGLIQAPENEYVTRNLLRMAAIALPLFVLLAAAGGYLIVRRSFRPLDTISAAASAINEAKDLSKRIGLPPGSDEFSRLAGTFDQLFERLERSFEAETQFTADASHELRTPVSIIKGACEYARKYDETPEDRQETLDMIYRQALKMSDLIAQLLSITRLEQGTEQPAMEPVRLNTLAEQVIRDGNYDVSRITADLSADAAVRGDAALLSRLLRNLIDNAFKYGRPNGHVWVSVRQEHGEILLSVRDDGIGIPKEYQEKIWQRFYQIDSSRSTDASGAGLGLAMVDQIARLHGGYMTLESIPEIGSSFTLHLPPA